MTQLRLAFTADLHWGVRAQGDEATRLLVEFLRAEPPEVLVLAGDVGAGDQFGECLALFAELPCRKALVPGNHDLWVTANDVRGDSLKVYHEHLPRLCQQYGFHYLDHGPLVFPEADLALVGSINWYDYSWSLKLPKAQVPDWEERLQTKRFTRGRHNDANFIRWPVDDVRFTAELVAAFRQHLQVALASVAQAIVVTHHPPFYGLCFDRPGPPMTLDSMLWDAFGGNRSLELLLTEQASRIAFAFCGHTHRARQNTLQTIQGYNIGGDYHFKRLLCLDWPSGTIEAHQFGDAFPLPS